MHISYSGLLQCIYHTMDYSNAYTVQWINPMHISYNGYIIRWITPIHISHNGLLQCISYNGLLRCIYHTMDYSNAHIIQCKKLVLRIDRMRRPHHPHGNGINAARRWPPVTRHRPMLQIPTLQIHQESPMLPVRSVAAGVGPRSSR